MEQSKERHSWTILRYKRNAIPNYGWQVMQGTLVIMGELTKEAARQLADNHNRCLSPEGETEDYWMLRGFAQYIADQNIACDREPCSCDQSSLCITEWCEPCIAKAWLQDQKSKEIADETREAYFNKSDASKSATPTPYL